ncbi:MAG: ATP-dependent zinc metalloprotease FtsH [Candidatus Shapirobacteria bacterium]|nr:ATP-dependent zinc metalloprotease FtsH [Candidatus Shapirobacteria bacterium]
MENKKIPSKPVKKYEFKFQINLKNLLIWLLVLAIIFSFFFSFPAKNQPTGEEIALSQALTNIKENKIKEIKIEENKIILTDQDGKTFFSRKESQSSFTEILKEADINPATANLTIKDMSMSQVWINILSGVLPFALMILFFFFIFRQARGAQDSIFSFGRSKTQIFSKGKQAVTFKDVAGVNEAKKELQEVVDFLKHPGKYRKLGARTPKGVLLVGPSGTGKTLLAKAVAGEAGVAFFSMAGSEFMEMLVGVGASRVRDLFNNAKKTAPSIIFIDEIDAIGRHRGTGFTGGHDEREQTLNQILVEMDGFTPNDNVMVLAATNRGDLLDPALLRPGRFDRRVVLDMPDVDDRKAILAIHARGKPFTKGVDWNKVARATVGFSGADLENMLNEAAISAARENKKEISSEHIDEASLKVKLGPQKKRLQSEEERKMTAYHEAGHAVASYYLPNMDPVNRISIVSRGVAMGFTLIPPRQDRLTETKSHLLETVATLLGGRAAEELIFKEFTAGAASDIDKATQIARHMVVDFGMSELGPIYLGPQVEMNEWGRSWAQPSEISQEMQAKIDQEIKRIIDRGYEQALGILKKQLKRLGKVALKLMEEETIEGDGFEKLMKENN